MLVCDTGPAATSPTSVSDNETSSWKMKGMILNNLRNSVFRFSWLFCGELRGDYKLLSGAWWNWSSSVLGGDHTSSFCTTSCPRSSSKMCTASNHDGSNVTKLNFAKLNQFYHAMTRSLKNLFTCAHQDTQVTKLNQVTLVSNDYNCLIPCLIRH